MRTSELLPASRAICDGTEPEAERAGPCPVPAQRPAAVETEAWAVIGAAGAVAEFSSYLMIFPDRQEALGHIIAAEGERLARVIIREVPGSSAADTPKVA